MTYLCTTSIIHFRNSSASLVSAMILKCNNSFRSAVMVVVTFHRMCDYYRKWRVLPTPNIIMSPFIAIRVRPVPVLLLLVKELQMASLGRPCVA
jgi:hypothetical protein